MKTIPRTAALAVLMATAAASAALADPMPSPSPSAAFAATTLNLAAAGETKVRPDMATIRLGVTTQAKSAAEALSANAARMSQVMAALRAAGIAAKDIQTANLNLNAQYAYDQNQPPRLTGYQAADELAVTVHELGRLGAVVDATVKDGADQVSGISFGLENPAAAEDAARLQAVQALQAKAELYARATGYRVSRLVSLSEGGGAEAPSAPMPMVRFAKSDAATTVSPGELRVRIEISGLYELTH